MIEAHELRIGNYVHNYDTDYGYSPESAWVAKVVELRENFVNLGKADAKYDEIEPIPLTNELLEKCGFQHHGEWHIKTEWPHSINISLTHEKVTIGVNEEYQVELEYLHELQNLFYALTKKELEINWHD